MGGIDSMIMIYVVSIVDYGLVTDWNEIPEVRQKDVAEAMINLGYEDKLYEIGYKG